MSEKTYGWDNGAFSVMDAPFDVDGHVTMDAPFDVDGHVTEVAIGVYGGWGDKGQEFRPDKCEHDKGDGCEWCCQQCNLDRHFCGGCGTVTDHRDTSCGTDCTG